MDDEELGIVAKSRGFVGSGDLVIDWKIRKYSGYETVGYPATEEQIDATVHMYDGCDEFWLGEEGLVELIEALQQALDAYNHFNNNKEETSE